MFERGHVSSSTFYKDELIKACECDLAGKLYGISSFFDRLLEYKLSRTKKQ
jgi:hypothetical protein